jgi:hypothetical protein
LGRLEKRQLRFVLLGAGEANPNSDQSNGFSRAREGFMKQ